MWFTSAFGGLVEAGLFSPMRLRGGVRGGERNPRPTLYETVPAPDRAGTRGVNPGHEDAARIRTRNQHGGTRPPPARTRCDHGFGLAPGADADMMSDMKTFTVRELDRTPAVVLAACDRDGEARIRRRDGRIYRLMPAAGPKRAITSLPDFAARRRHVSKKPLSAAQTRLADEALRGE